MLLELGFLEVCATWIVVCARGVSYSILLNGIPYPPFQAKKGLRQENPLSPFLFAVSVENLIRCLVELRKNLDFNFHHKCERIHLAHLMFVNDLLLFTRVDLRYVTKMIVVF